MWRRLRGILGMSAVWAIAWAGTGLLIGVASVLTPFLPWERFFDVFDAPLPALGVPGAVGGAIFGVVLLAAARQQRFDQLSLPRFTALGAVGGVLLSLVPEAMVALGLATLNRPDLATIGFLLAKGALLGALGAASAAATLLIARRATARDLPSSPDDEAALYNGEVRHLAASAPVATVKSRSAISSPGKP